MTKRRTVKQWGEKIVALTPQVLQNFRAIPGTSGRYLIDRNGNAISTSNVSVPHGYAWKLSPSKSRVAYPTIRLCIYFDDGRRIVGRARLVLMAWVGQPPSAHHQACHLDGDGTNDALDNLEWRLPVGVKKECIKRGTWVHGSRTHTARWAPEQVFAIKRIAMEFNVPTTLLATALGEKQSRIKEIVAGDSWGGKAKALAQSGKFSKLPREHQP